MIYTNDQKLFCGDNGIGIVLLHGVTSGCAQMIPLGRMLNDYGYTVHCVNIAGHGTYPQELLRTSWEDAIDKATLVDRVFLGELHRLIDGDRVGDALEEGDLIYRQAQDRQRRTR